MSPLAVVRSVLARTSSRARALVLGAMVISLAARLVVVWTAILAGQGNARAATVGAIAAAALFAVGRVVQVIVRAVVESELHQATAKAVLEADVLSSPVADAPRVAFLGIANGTNLAALMLPTFAADVVATALLVPVLFDVAPMRVVGLAVLALAVLAAGVFVVRGATRRLEARTQDAYQELCDTLHGAIEGRLEIVASGGEEQLLRRFAQKTAAYEALVRRSSYRTALLGRAPILAGAIAVAAVVVLDTSSRDALASVVVTRAVVLAACIPPALGAVLGAHALVRMGPVLATFTSLLDVAARTKRGASTVAVPSLPASVEGEGLRFAYGAGASVSNRACVVLDDIGFTWPTGKPLLLFGANGSGKSTLLRLLVGLRAPASGTVVVGGEDLAKLDDIAWRRSIAFLPQRPWLGETHVTVQEALSLACPEASVEAMQQALERTNVWSALVARGDALSVRVGELSAGQRQRVAIARILLQDARVVLLDEPDANLDREGIALVGRLIASLVAEGRMVAVAAHSPELASEDAARIDL